MKETPIFDPRIDILAGAQVRLVAMREEYAEGLWAAGKHPEIWTYMHLKQPIASAEDMAEVVRQAIQARDRKEECAFAIIDNGTGCIVGSTRYLDISAANRSAEIGWTWLTPAVWRTRINTECKYLLLRHAFETAGAVRVQLKTDARNLRSQRAIERIGGVKEGVLRKHRVMLDGYIRDSVYYSILDSEWPDVKARLERLLSDPAGGDC